MRTKSEYAEKLESCCLKVFKLRRDLNDKIGDIIRLDYANGKLLRRIGVLEGIVVEKNAVIGTCLRRIDEHLQDKARLANRVECLKGELAKYEPAGETTAVPDMEEYQNLVEKGEIQIGVTFLYAGGD